MVEGWKYYNHAALPTTAPHEDANLDAVKSRRFWQNFDGKKPLLARWTTEFDCGYETSWWYVIKDTPFDMSSVGSNYRRKIRKGASMFDIQKIVPNEWREELFEVETQAFSSWPEKYRPKIEKTDFFKTLEKWSASEVIIVYGAFFRENQELCGYILAPTYEHWTELRSQRVKPQYEKYQINAALIYGYLSDVQNRVGADFYICDGARSIRHETAFQDYLEKYFNFRKAYCKLHIRYRFPLSAAIWLLYPMKSLFPKEGKMGQYISSLLTMEKYARECR